MVQYGRILVQDGRILVQDGRIWSQMVGFGPRWSDLVQYGRILVQDGRILVQHDRIWFKMIGCGPKWADLVPKVVKQSQQKYLSRNVPKLIGNGSYSLWESWEPVCVV